VYVLFAVMAGASHTIIIEGIIAGAFIAVAVVGTRRSNHRAAGLLVAGGLAVHGVYDLVHSSIVSNPVVPGWWPPFCGVVDISLAGWVIVLRNQDTLRVQSAA
jgi:hypothetical protein